MLRLLAVAACAACVACSACGRAPSREASSAGAKASPRIVAATTERILEEVRRPGARVVLLNVWATWCAPCRQEFPDLTRLGRNYRARGLRLVLVSADFDDALPAARRFLAEHGVEDPTYLKTGDDMAFINALDPAWSGALPATFLYDGEGRRLRSWVGRQSYETFEQAVRNALDGKTVSDSAEVRS
jgi:thiol-disulfide isomerase/thioredoxin